MDKTIIEKIGKIHAGMKASQKLREQDDTRNLFNALEKFHKDNSLDVETWATAAKKDQRLLQDFSRLMKVLELQGIPTKDLYDGPMGTFRKVYSGK